MYLCDNLTLQDPAGSRANLEGVNLKGAVLEGSIMAGINLRVATLKNVNMQNCDLRMAVLVSVLLTLQHPSLTLLICQAGADLENCNLSGSDLHEANLRGANLKVICNSSVFSSETDVSDRCLTFSLQDATLELMLTPLHMSQTIR